MTNQIHEIQRDIEQNYDEVTRDLAAYLGVDVRDLIDFAFDSVQYTLEDVDESSTKIRGGSYSTRYEQTIGRTY